MVAVRPGFIFLDCRGRTLRRSESSPPLLSARWRFAFFRANRHEAVVPEVIKVAGEKVKALVEAAVQKLETALRNGESRTLRTYLKAMSRFSRYSLGNMLLIGFQRPDATRVAGFRAWQKLGRWVRKGERGIVIRAPTVRRTKPCRDSVGEEPAEAREAGVNWDKGQCLTGFRAAHVFDVSQTDGKPLPELGRVRGDPQQHLDGLKQFAASRGIRVEYADGLGGAEGVSMGGAVRIRKGLSPAEEFGTLAHEVGHELLHRDSEQTTKVVRETEAEAVAFVVCEAAGLENGSAASDYIQLYDGKAETLMASLQRIRGAAVAIIEGVGLGGSPLENGRTAA